MLKDKGTYIYDGNVYDLFLEASDILSRAVTHTLGPKGTNSAIPTQNEYLSIINDGKSIVERLSSDDKALRFAMNTLKESSFATNQRASDGPQPLYAHVLTPKGFKQLKEIKVGDTICGTNGTKQKVLGVFYKGKLPLYRVHFDDDTYVECSNNHLWSVYDNTRNNPNLLHTITIDDMLDRSVIYKGRSDDSIQYRFFTPKTFVEFNKQKITLDPYLLGVLLGDGHIPKFNRHYTVSITIGYSKKDKIIPKLILPEGIYLSVHDQPKRHALKLNFCGRTKDGKTMLDYCNDLGLCGVHSETKFIPKKYLYNTKSVREQLLQGLMDTDGTISDRKLREYTTVSPILAKDIKDLMSSLGYDVKIYTKDYNKYANNKGHYGNKVIYVIHERRGYNLGHKIVAIESMNRKVDMMCIKVSNEDQLYITDNYKVTHNTSSSIVIQNQLLNHIRDWNDTYILKPIDSKFILEARDQLLDLLKVMKKEVESEQDLRNVITVSLGGDEYTDLVLEAFDGLNKNQMPTLVKTQDQREITVETIDGINLNQVEMNPVVLRSMPLTSNEELDVIIITQQVSRIDTYFAKLLERISKSPRKTILLYTEIMPSVMDQILFNIQEGGLSVVPIQIRGTLDDIEIKTLSLAEYFKCKIIDDLHPYQVVLNDMGDYVGRSTGYILNKGSVVLKGTNEEYSSEVLPSKSSVINVGFTTFSKQDEDYRRLEDAIGSTYNAINTGYVLGAGYTYYCLVGNEDIQLDERYSVLLEALSFIFKKLYKDSGFENEIKFIEYIENNVYDSYKVAEQVILNSFTVVAQVLSTNVVLIDY